MPYSTCKVWGCSSPIRNSKYSRYCKVHAERIQRDGHPTFKQPALTKRYDSYNQELAIAYHSGKRWFKQADLTLYEQSFGRLLDEAEQLPALSPYRRLGDLPYRKQLLFLLKASVDRVGRQETMKQWLCVYKAASFKKDLFPNRETLAVFVCRKSLRLRAALPTHITKSGKKKSYVLYAKRALKMVEILAPIFDLAFISPNNMALWYRSYSNSLNHSNAAKARMKKHHERNPNHAKSIVRLKHIKSITNKYLGG